jgi:SAM-dependent methyltransferase
MTQIDNDIMEAYTVIFDGLEHLGPGDADMSKGVVKRLSNELPAQARVVDFGCGTGASTLVLAECLPESRILALDMHEPFIAQLNSTADARGLGERICAVTGDMGKPPPLDGMIGEFDLIWCESAIYSIGRSDAFACWHSLLKPGGWLVFSEIVWGKNPDKGTDEVIAFWENEYPGITTADTVINELRSADFSPLAPVFASQKAWSNYYEPLRQRMQLLKQQKHQVQALDSVMAGIEKEIEIYDCADDEVAIAFFLAKRNAVD